MKKLKLFISFEGGEGTGKSTVSKLLQTKLEVDGYKVFLTREPGGTGSAFAEDVRKVIMDHGGLHPVTEVLLFAASRKEHIDKKIIPSLEEGTIVISDRFSDSTVVYQGVAKGVPINIVNTANDLAVGDHYPNLVFIFDLDPAEGLTRIADRKIGNNRFDSEGLVFHQKIREAYLELAKSDPNRYILIDASKTPEEILDDIYNIVIKYNEDNN